jgi:hypothetical protein
VPKSATASSRQPAVEIACPFCQHPIAVLFSTPAPANAHLPRPVPPQPPPPSVRTSDPCCYSLHRERACWLLEFKDDRAFLKHEIGLAYVAHLLAHHDEPVPSATLFSRFSTRHRNDLPSGELPDPETGALTPVTDGVGFSQLPPDKDEAEARRRYYAQLREYKEAFSDGSNPEPERDEARLCYDELLTFLKQHYRPERDPGSSVIRHVHRSIQRLCTSLRKPVAGQSESMPDPVALAFAEYIEQHILMPSRRYTRAKPGSNVRLARGELAAGSSSNARPDTAGQCAREPTLIWV